MRVSGKQTMLLLIVGSVGGAAFLCALSLLQKLIISAPLGLLGFIIPSLFGGVAGFVISLWGVRLKRSNRQLKASNREKERLLKELDHRVKNNLQIISSLFSLSSSFAGETIQTQYKQSLVLEQIKERVYLLAYIHEQLYDSVLVEQITAHEYLQSISAYVQSQYHQTGVDFVSKIENVDCKVNDAVPIGMLIYEIVSNAYLHAFPDSVDRNHSRWEIQFSLNQNTPETLQLKISDNGVGFSYEKELSKGSSLGIQLINILTKQIGGELSFTGSPGAAYWLTFPLSVSNL